MPVTVRYRYLGLVDYDEALSLQRRLLDEVAACGHRHGYILGCEHPPVVTLGRSAREGHLLSPPEVLRRSGISVRRADRGGDVTYHGPGQAVVYPVLPVGAIRRDVHWYLRMLEEAGIRLLSRYGIAAGRREGLTGVWVGGNKIMAIGVAFRRWVSYHGLALNVAGCLEGFRHIVPCGIRDRGVTSIERETGMEISVEEICSGLAEELAAVLDLEPAPGKAPAIPFPRG